MADPKDSAQLQLDLEENFFFNQKSSVKQSIAFVSDRLSNNLIKTISQRIVAKEVSIVLADLKDTVTLLKEATSQVRLFTCH